MYGEGLYPGHPLGSHFVSHERRLVYLNIPKCGSTSVKHALGSLSFEYVEFPERYDGYDWFTILRRDIVDRWVSGSIEWWERLIVELERQLDVMQFELEKDPTRTDLSVDDSPSLEEYAIGELEHLIERNSPTLRDAHTFPQSVFIPPYVKLSKVFYMENGLDDLADFLSISIPNLNVKDNSKKNVFYELMEDEHINVLSDFYKIDKLLLDDCLNLEG